MIVSLKWRKLYMRKFIGLSAWATHRQNYMLFHNLTVEMRAAKYWLSLRYTSIDTPSIQSTVISNFSLWLQCKCTYWFQFILRMNSRHFPQEHLMIDLCNIDTVYIL
jgi:hypothetical protein